MQNAKCKLQNIVTALLLYNLLLPCSNPAYTEHKIKREHTKGVLSFNGTPEGIRILNSQCEWDIRIVLFAKNSPLDCFLNAQTLTGSNPS